MRRLTELPLDTSSHRPQFIASGNLQSEAWQRNPSPPRSITKGKTPALRGGMQDEKRSSAQPHQMPKMMVLYIKAYSNLVQRVLLGIFSPIG